MFRTLEGTKLSGNSSHHYILPPLENLWSPKTGQDPIALLHELVSHLSTNLEVVTANN